MCLFLLDERAKLRKIDGIIKANTSGRKEVFYVSLCGTVRFPCAKRMFPHRETYVLREGNIESALRLERYCLIIFRKIIFLFHKKSYLCCTTLMVQYNDFHLGDYGRTKRCFIWVSV